MFSLKVNLVGLVADDGEEDGGEDGGEDEEEDTVASDTRSITRAKFGAEVAKEVTVMFSRSKVYKEGAVDTWGRHIATRFGKRDKGDKGFDRRGKNFTGGRSKTLWQGSKNAQNRVRRIACYRSYQTTGLCTGLLVCYCLISFSGSQPPLRAFS